MSKIVFGTGGRFGRLTHDLALELVSFGLQSGISVFDTGIAYSGGRSQALLFKCLSQQKIVDIDSLFISTKVDASLPLETIYSLVSASVADLGSRGFIDVLFLWGPTREQLLRPGLSALLQKLLAEGLIKSIGVNTHDASVMQFLLSHDLGYDCNHVMLDYNLLQQDRALLVKRFALTDVTVWAGTALCQGFLLESLFEIYARTRSFSYLARALFNPSTNRLLKPARFVRTYMRQNYPACSKLLPLSFVLADNYVSYVPIGMLSRSSISFNQACMGLIPPLNVVEDVALYASRFQLPSLLD